ncbi:iron-containing alcohol dehydrogenase [Patescibacteria group bacterium]|nr:iron-containing alcohol dehydrogenase [Patescibacteria group bacterium]
MRKTVYSLPELEWCDLTRYNDQQPAIVLTTPHAKIAAEYFLKQINLKEIIYVQSSQKVDVNQITAKYVKAQVVYAIGGGRVIDIGRYLASRWGLKIICIPTIISSDAFLVDCTGIRENGCVTYVPSKKADRILLDWELLKKVPLKYHLSGCGDVLSIYTGVYDWKYVNKLGIASSDESYSQSVAITAKGILDSLLSETEEIKKGTKKGLEILITCLGMEVTLCNFFGNSRPEEGGEHFFTYCIENKIPRFLHGEMVCFGVLITSFLQKQPWRPLKKFMDTVGINYKPDGLTLEIILETLEEISDYVKIHNLRFSVYNNFLFKDYENKTKSFLKEIFKI